MKNLRKIKGDASFRKFFRKKIKNFSSIIVVAKKEKFKNLIIYDAVNKILNNNEVLAPRLYSENYKKSFIEIQDFGDETIFKILNKKKRNKLFYFKKIIKVLNQIQKISDKKIKNFKNKNYILPKYKRKILVEEANLFCKWYVKNCLPKERKAFVIKRLKKIIIKLSLSLKLKNDVFVHRDFHVSNLMLFKNRIGVIDSQDALIGNKAYDLASLIDDVRINTSIKLKEKIYNLYIKNHRNLVLSKFNHDFEVLSVLRNLKIIGIFTRLALRDGKKNYLKLIPNAWKLINIRIKKNKIFSELRNLLYKNFKRELNED